jgi:hypothetical protein
MLQANVVNVSSVSDVCCSKCFMLQVLHQQALQGEHAEVVPSDAVVHVCAGSEAAATQARSTKLYPWPWQQVQRANSRRGARDEAKHEATFLGGQQARSTRQSEEHEAATMGP